MKGCLVMFCIFCTLVLVDSAQQQSPDRSSRIFDWFGLDSILPRCRGCPPRGCIRDSAVVKGYCCGCARVSDLMPIDCPAVRIHCPPDGRRLCRDYDYMMDCCCP